MKRRIWPLGLIGAVLLASSCEEITTSSETSTFRVSVSVEDSPFVLQGLMLVGDQVRFQATVTENGQPVSASGQRFVSSMPGIVDILDENTGQAVFRGVGTADVTVTVAEPRLEGSEPLQATIRVRVTEYLVELGLESTVTGTAVSPSDGLVGDVVRVVPTVRLERNDSVVTSGGLTIVSSSNTSVINPAPGADDEAALQGEGNAVLTVTLDQPDIPGTGNRLTETIEVTVNDFMVAFGVSSEEDDSFLQAGDTLVTDSVRFSATLMKAGSPEPTSGAMWASSDSFIVAFRDAAAGIAVFRGDTGTATVSVTFQDPPLPGPPASTDVRVTEFIVDSVLVESLFTGPGALTDTLKSDSVRFSVAVTETRDKQSELTSIMMIESTDSAVVNPVVNAIATDEAVISDAGRATVTVSLAQPRLPRDTLRPTVVFPVGTYIATIDNQTPASPIMGDTIQYAVSVTDTRPDPDTLLSTFSVNYTSSDASVIRVEDAAVGKTFARDTGTATVTATLTGPTLPNPTAVVSDSRMTPITVERFYGLFNKTSGTFGATQNGDTVKVAASEVHFFTDSTRVLFPNGTLGFVDRVTVAGDSLIFLVPAAADTGQLTLRNLKDDLGGFRDNVLTRIVFDGPGSAVVDDFFEPNDNFPLTAGLEITSFPFEALLSWDPSKSMPADTNFLYFELTSTTTLDFTAEWQQDANVDFKLCNGNANPPTDYVIGGGGNPICQFFAQSLDRSQESQTAPNLSPNIYVIVYYCVDCPATLPLTYRVRIQ